MASPTREIVTRLETASESVDVDLENVSSGSTDTWDAEFADLQKDVEANLAKFCQELERESNLGMNFRIQGQVWSSGTDLLSFPILSRISTSL